MPELRFQRVLTAVRRAFRVLLGAILLIVLAATAQLAYLALRINWTGAHDRAQAADAIVVLGARVEADGRPGPDLTSRTRHAVGLYRQGLAPYVICTGGYHGDPLSAASVARRLAISLGVPADALLLADGSMTTSEDAASARRLMDARGWQAAVLVSHPLHLERARLLFEGQGITAYPSPTSTDLRAIPWRTRAWLTAREAMGILWIGLAELGVPDEWAVPLGERLYGARRLPEPGDRPAPAQAAIGRP